MAKRPDFTDAELNIIGVVCAKADPMGLMDQIKTIQAKIQAYAAEMQTETAPKQDGKD